MSEARILVAILALLGGFAFLQTMDPRWTLRVVTLGLNLVNLIMTVINWNQARHRDSRFLAAGWLGAIQLGTGVIIGALFGGFLGFASILTWLAGLPFIVGGLLVLGAAWYQNASKLHLPSMTRK